MIRCTSKALIVWDGMVLLNRCVLENGRVYYDLPGGGQNSFETMEEAVCREVLEETGYVVRVEAFAGIAEEIYTNEDLRTRFPDYAHRILHIFRAVLTDAPRRTPTEKDMGMDKSEWIPIPEIPGLTETRPASLKERLPEILNSPAPVYLGPEYNPTTV